MTQDRIKIGIEKWHNVYLTPYSKIAQKAEVSPQFLNMFLKGERRLGRDTEKIFTAILEEVGL